MARDTDTGLRGRERSGRDRDLRNLRGTGRNGNLRNLRDLGGKLGGLSGSNLRSGRNRDLRNLAGDTRDVGGLLNGADGGRDSNSLGGDDGAVDRAVGNLRRASSDGVDHAGVDGRGGQRDSAGGNGGRLRRAVGDGRTAVSDSDQLGGVVGGHSGSVGGNGTSGQEGGSSSETHLEYVGSKRTGCSCKRVSG